MQLMSSQGMGRSPLDDRCTSHQTSGLWQYGELTTGSPTSLRAGDHVHLGPGVAGTRRTNPAVDLHDLPNIHLVLLSHYHG
jgi:hypothetical protein